MHHRALRPWYSQAPQFCSGHSRMRPPFFRRRSWSGFQPRLSTFSSSEEGTPTWLQASGWPPRTSNIPQVWRPDFSTLRARCRNYIQFFSRVCSSRVAPSESQCVRTTGPRDLGPRHQRSSCARVPPPRLMPRHRSLAVVNLCFEKRFMRRITSRTKTPRPCRKAHNFQSLAQVSQCCEPRAIRPPRQQGLSNGTSAHEWRC